MPEPIPLPPGYRLARAGLADAGAIFELVAASDTDVLGTPDIVLDDVLDELSDPDFDLATDGWLAYAPDGRLVAWAWTCRKGDSDNADVTVAARTGDDALLRHLWTLVQDRAVDNARALGHRQVVMDTAAYRNDHRRRALLTDLGFTQAATFQRLRIDHDGPRPQPGLPPGTVVRLGSEGDDVRRLGHAVRNEAFVDHFGFVPSRYADWHAQLDGSGSGDWAQLRLVVVDGEPAAMLLGTNNFLNENCGYVRTLGVRKQFRGRGLARYLLRQAFAHDAGLGRAGTYLHVDSAGAPAMGLYLSEGMRRVLVMDDWRRTVPIGD